MTPNITYEPSIRAPVVNKPSRNPTPEPSLLRDLFVPLYKVLVVLLDKMRRGVQQIRVAAAMEAMESV
jgi:hypothetical protein